jgi:hypothetical protein
MVTLAATHWVGQLLRKLPAPVITLLDAWSARKARDKVQARRLKARHRRIAAPVPYQPKPWRD